MQIHMNARWMWNWQGEMDWLCVNAFALNQLCTVHLMMLSVLSHRAVVLHCRISKFNWKVSSGGHFLLGKLEISQTPTPSLELACNTPSVNSKQGSPLWYFVGNNQISRERKSGLHWAFCGPSCIWRLQKHRMFVQKLFIFRQSWESLSWRSSSCFITS